MWLMFRSKKEKEKEECRKKETKRLEEELDTVCAETQRVSEHSRQYISGAHAAVQAVSNEADRTLQIIEKSGIMSRRKKKHDDLTDTKYGLKAI